ncbi:MAG: transporter substrate-binding domain-containing protein [Alphaproteobacteria bacterium]
MGRIARLAGAVFLALGASAAAAATGTLAEVTARGTLRCGVSAAAVSGFATRDDAGRWTGFEIDYCRAIAAAVLADAEAVRFVALNDGAGAAALARGSIDVLADGTPWTAGRDAGGLEFPAVTFYDGQVFLVPRALGVRSALELDGARICVLAGDGSIARLEAFFARHLMEHVVLMFRAAADMFAAYDEALCDAVSTTRRRLALGRSGLDAPDEHVILPELVAKEPLALAVAGGDPPWADVVRWVHMALLVAEEVGLDQDRAAGADGAGDGVLDGDREVARGLGLEPGWTRRAVAAGGHYGELFARHLGPGSEVGLERGPNALWRDGGLHYPPPLR